jgi:AbiV family abortive infection protein
MPPTYPPLPSRDDLLVLVRAALANAKDLLNDAQLLADAGRFPRSLALATLSWEELSKADLCVIAMVLPEVTSDYFWENFRDHEGKLARVHAFEWVDGFKALSKSTQNLKERSLYVDFRRGKILLPTQVTEKAARKQIKAVREALDFAERAFSGESVRMMFTQLNPNATAAALQEAIRDGNQQKFGH